MITPAFTISQDNDFVTIVIKTPHIKAQNVDLEVDGAVFKFNLKPYFLRLTFPGNIVEDERSKATYDVGAGELTVVLAKETAGEHFPDLDMLSRLLVRKSDLAEKQVRRPLIEVINSGETLEGIQKLEKDEDFDWEMPQEIRQEVFTNVRYGFNNRYSGFFTHVQETANDVLDVYDPEHVTLETRRQNRIQRENDKFDDEYYMSDFMNENEIQHLLKFKTHWWHELRAIQKAEKDALNKKPQPEAALTSSNTNTRKKDPVSLTSTSTSTTFTQSQTSTPFIFNIAKDDFDNSAPTRHLESFDFKQVSTRSISGNISEPSTAGDLILNIKSSSTTIEALIPAEEPLIDESEPLKHLGPHSITIVDSSQPSLNSQLEDDMADLSLGATDASIGVKPFSSKELELMRDLPRRESALDQFTTLTETLVACFRRVLAYPLYRNWNLAMKVLQDVYMILKLGRRGILRALLEVKEILDHDDVYYIYSKMFIEDYCVWIQSASEKVIRTLAHELHHFPLNKSEIGWHLEELEALAKEAPEEEDEEEEENTSEDDSEDSNETSSDSDASSEENNNSDHNNEEKDTTTSNNDNSIFIHEGPRPMIIEL
ncbi:hypothetical protein BGZ65_006013 [Modicella reniformis]|uniref:CS domain-containing protein n=1 Tax=Modicella reniformis TaxID=1440133 RepID=A0A9P6IWP3_9FUNG|nr:hypothetical protein BGZ65_006013 [Modicella reniformis]